MRPTSFLNGLRGRLLFLTAGFVLFAVFLIYPLLAAGFRNSWLREHVQAAEIAAMALEAAPDGRVSEELSRQLLDGAQVVSVAIVGEDFRELVLAPAIPIDGPIVPVDLRVSTGLMAVSDTFGHLIAPKGRFLMIVMPPTMLGEGEMEVIVPERALRRELAAFSRSLLVISLVISAVVGALVYLSIYRLVVRPMKGLTDSVIRFGESPEAAVSDFQPGRSDEMRRARDALRAMQQAVSASFRQRKRLADLGEAVAKINHDLRNSLAAAKIVSEGLAHSEDPRVRRAAPRLERALERAIGLAEATLKYGRADPPRPLETVVDLRPVIEEAAAEALIAWPEVAFTVEGPDVSVLADPDLVHRILGNLFRNAARAMATQASDNRPGQIVARIEPRSDLIDVLVVDNGPGVPPRVVDKLFLPFAAAGPESGAGLGLAIARELARAMGGEVELTSTGPAGAVFVLRLRSAAASAGQDPVDR